jgi:hypothetical protein
MSPTKLAVATSVKSAATPIAAVKTNATTPITAAPAATPKPRKMKGTLERVNGRIIRMKAWVTDVSRLFKGTKTDTDLAALVEGLDDVSKGLFALHESGWKAPRRNAFAAGDAVVLRKKHAAEYAAAFGKDVADLVVASIHGKMARVMFAGKDDGIGLVPMARLAKVEAK